MSEWMVHGEFSVPVDVDDDQIGTLLEVLADYHGSVSGGRGLAVGLTFTLEAEDARRAAAGGYEVAIGALMKAGVEHRRAIRLEAADADVVAAELAVSNFPDVVGSAEAADMLGVTRQRLHQLRSSGRFPEPIVELAGTPIWLRAAIQGFLDSWDRKPGRPQMTDEEAAVMKEWREAAAAVTAFFGRHAGPGKQFGENELTSAEHDEQNALMDRLQAAKEKVILMRARTGSTSLGLDRGGIPPSAERRRPLM